MQKRSIAIAGHKTSVALEAEFWAALEEIARARRLTLARLIAEIDAARTEQDARQGLASALRVFVLENAAGARRLR